MSLLPYLRKVPEQRKMLVRTKLQQIFCEEELHGEHRAQHVSSGYTHAAGGSSNQSWESGSTVTVTPQNTPERTSLRILLIQLIENSTDNSSSVFKQKKGSVVLKRKGNTFPLPQAEVEDANETTQSSVNK
ncbi:hypothetical protein J437_LFUL008622 [Ladona fulva]|uniref:BESS domain-containing protein n=1 Tax=Ladona fulva TaxID=123851 RepID=A0A8K0KD15_LADFU|nr:hypothetical protein J437_LFUL008622 [Ladona fulva]